LIVPDTWLNTGSKTCGKAEEVESLRFAEPTLLAVHRRLAAELDQAGLLRMERQSERLKPRTHRIEETTGVLLVLETGNQIVAAYRTTIMSPVASRRGAEAR
jgi:hypothetical protein